VCKHYSALIIASFATSIFLLGIGFSNAAVTCTLVVNPTVDFSNQLTEISIPNNEDAIFCGLTQVSTKTGELGTGSCLVQLTQRAADGQSKCGRLQAMLNVM